MKSTKAVLIGRNKLFLQGLRSLLTESGHEVVHQAQDVDFLTEQYELEGSLDGPDLVLLDRPNDAEQIADDVGQIRSACPKAAIIVLTDDLCSRCLSACLAAGADAYLEKNISMEALLQSIGLVLVGEKVLPSKLAALLVNGFSDTVTPDGKMLADLRLSEREMQILRCLVVGNSNKVIANRLSITEATVKVHMKSVLRKIKLNNRTQAAIWALNNGLAGPAEAIAAQ